MDRGEFMTPDPILAPGCPDCGTPLSAGACPACAFGMLLAQPDHAIQPPDSPGNVEFGRYVLTRRLAAGGMGVVYIAEDLKLKRTVALKMIRGSTFANEAELARFTIEAEAAAALDHPNIVPIYEVGHFEDQPFFTMKLIEGQSLAERLRSTGGKLPARELAVLLGAIARAVHHAHQRGVLHRDLKPGNILLDQSGHPWLTDFGLAKLAHAESGLTLSTDHIGTPHYMSPEIAGGTARQASTASDVWALGVLLWEMLCGMPPFHGIGAVEIMRRIVEHEPSWPGGEKADEDLITLARRCMEKDPARRPVSAGEVADELDRWLRGEPIKARRITRGERFLKWVRRKPALAAMYAALAVGGIASLLLWQRAESVVVSLKETNQLMEESLRISTATKLAGDARLQVTEDANRALLLALEAVEMTEDLGVLPEAASSLMGVLQQAGGFDATAGGLRDDYQSAYIDIQDFQRRIAQPSPDGRWLLSAGFYGFATTGTMASVMSLKDPDDTSPRRRFTLWPAFPIVPAEANFCWLPDSRRILTVTNDGKVGILEVISPAVESGKSDDSPPEWTQPWSLPKGENRFLRIHLHPGVPGGEGPAVIWHRIEGEVSHLGRVRLTPDGWQADPVIQIGGTMGARCSSFLAPNGRWLIACCRGVRDQVLLLDVTQPAMAPLVLPVGDCSVTHVHFTPDSRRLALLRDEEEAVCLTLPETLDGEMPSQDFPLNYGNCRRLAVSPDHRWLALGSESGEVTLYPVGRSAPPVHLKMRTGQAIALQFSPDSQWLAAGGLRRVVHVWPVKYITDGTEPLLLYGMVTPVTELQFTSDSQAVIACGVGEVARFWPFASRTGAAMPQQLPAGTFRAMDVAVSPDGQWVASAGLGRIVAAGKSDPGVVTLARLDGPEFAFLADHAFSTTGVAFSPDGRHLASTGRDGTVKIWDFPALSRALLDGVQPLPAPRWTLDVGKIRRAYEWRIAFHPDGRLYLVNGDGKLITWDLSAPDVAASRQQERIHSIDYLLPDAAVSRDGRLLAVTRHGWDAPVPDSVQYGAQVLLFDVAKSWPPVFLKSLRSDFLENADVCISPDGRWVASGATSFGPCLWDLHAPDVAASRVRAPLNADVTAAVAFAPNGTWLAMGGDDGILYLWNWLQPNDLRSIQTGSAIRSIAWASHSRVVTAGGDAHVKVWETDIARLKSLARRVAGRQLSTAERTRFRVPAR